MTTIAGIDPGKTGAITVINTNRNVFTMMDMPVRALSATSKRREVDAVELADFLYHLGVDRMIIEDVWSTPNDGHVGAFNFGASSGVLIGIAAGLLLPLDRVRPQTWKKTMKLSADKDEARARAGQLIPAGVELYKRKKDDGRAESALIALYGIFNQGIALKTPLQYIEDKGDWDA